MAYTDEKNANYLQGALYNTNYKPKNYYDWQYIANQQIANPNLSDLYGRARQDRNTALSRLNLNYDNSLASLDNSYKDSKENLQTSQVNQNNAAIKRSIAGGMGGSGGLAGYRTDTIKDSFKPSFDRIDRDYKFNTELLNQSKDNKLADLMRTYKDSIAKVDDKKADRGLKVASEATRLLQQDTQGYRNWQGDISKMLQDYGKNQADLSYKQQQDAYKRQQDEFANNLAMQKFSWDKERSMLPYQYPSANSLLPYNMGPNPYQQAQLSKSGGNDKSTAYAAAYQAILSNPATISDPEFIQSFLAAGLTPSDYSALLEMLGQ